MSGNRSMRTTERIRPVALAGESVRNLPVVLISLFIAVAGVDILLVTQPAFVSSLRDGWQGWMQGGVVAPWATVLGAAASVACVAVAAAVLTVVVRGIVEQPYLWLASALVAGCCFAIVRMNVEVPLRLPTPVFACMSAVLLVGGGAFLQGRSVMFSITGIFLLAVPLALLAIGYTQGQTSSGAAYSLDHNARLLLGTLSIASAGTLVIAIAARRLRALGGSAALGTPSAEQLAELIERARAGELRAAEAEYRLHLVRDEERAPQLDDEYELLRSRGSGLRRFAWWTSALFVLGGAALAFFAGYLPLQQQLASQQKINHTLTQQHAAAIAKLRADVAGEREALRQTVQAEEPAPPAAAPAVAPADAPARSVGAVAPAVASPAQPVQQSAKPERRPKPEPIATAPAAAPRAQAKPSSEPRKLEAGARKAKPVERQAAAPSAPPASKAQRAADTTSQEPARQNRSPVAKSDDPLEGLDGM